MVDARAICDTCGHTRDWHDRDAERVRRGSDPPVERPCYRDVGGAACGCGGFRESGTFAMRPGFNVLRAPRPDWTSPRVAILVLLLVVLGLALLYAYRSQTPSTPTVSITQAVQDVTAGRVNAVTVVGTRATLQFRDSSSYKEQTTIPEPDTLLSRAVADYNAANPSRAVAFTYQQENQSIGLVWSILLSLVPVLVLGGSLYYMTVRARRRS